MPLDGSVPSIYKIRNHNEQLNGLQTYTVPVYIQYQTYCSYYWGHKNSTTITQRAGVHRNDSVFFLNLRNRDIRLMLISNVQVQLLWMVQLTKFVICYLIYDIDTRLTVTVSCSILLQNVVHKLTLQFAIHDSNETKLYVIVGG